jgi:hypothetical protein
LSNLSDGDWILLVKNSLFWKAKIEQQPLQPDGEERYLLKIGYGKNKALSLHSDPSQELQYPSRDKAINNLNKLFKDKIKNGYEPSTFELCEQQASKEPKPSNQKKARDLEVDTVAGFDPEANNLIEHKCQKIPTVLTFNFGDSDGEANGLLQRDDSAEEDQQEEEEEDFTLGKRNIEAHHNEDFPAEDQADKQEATNSDHLMTISDMLDQKRLASSDAKFVPQIHKRPPDYFLSNTPKRETDTKKTSKETSQAKVATSSNSRQPPPSQSKEHQAQRMLGVSLSASLSQQAHHETEEQTSRQNRNWCPFPNADQMSQFARTHLEATEVQMPEPINWVFKRKIHGTNLYEVSQHCKTFTESLTIQTKDIYLYLEYEVNEDMALSKKELHQFSNSMQPVMAAIQIEHRVKDHGYVRETEELSAGLGYGTINSLKSRTLHFKDHSKLIDPPPEVHADAQTPRPSAQKSNASKSQPGSDQKSGLERNSGRPSQAQFELPEEPEPDLQLNEEESEEEVQEQGENLEYECLSHSRKSLLQENLEVQSVRPLVDLYEETLVKRSQLRQHWKNADSLKRPNMSIYPLGPASEGMIPLMLLHNFKPSLDINSSTY